MVTFAPTPEASSYHNSGTDVDPRFSLARSAFETSPASAVPGEVPRTLMRDGVSGLQSPDRIGFLESLADIVVHVHFSRMRSALLNIAAPQWLHVSRSLAT